MGVFLSMHIFRLVIYLLRGEPKQIDSRQSSWASSRPLILLPEVFWRVLVEVGEGAWHYLVHDACECARRKEGRARTWPDVLAGRRLEASSPYMGRGGFSAVPLPILKGRPAGAAGALARSVSSGLVSSPGPSGTKPGRELLLEASS